MPCVSFRHLMSGSFSRGVQIEIMHKAQEAENPTLGTKGNSDTGTYVGWMCKCTMHSHFASSSRGKYAVSNRLWHDAYALQSWHVIMRQMCLRSSYVLAWRCSCLSI